MCTWRVACVRVAQRADIKVKFHIFCLYLTYWICVCLFMNKGSQYHLNPQLSDCLSTLHSPDYYHIALFGTCIIIILQKYLFCSWYSSIRIADEAVARKRFKHLFLNDIIVGSQLEWIRIYFKVAYCIMIPWQLL